MRQQRIQATRMKIMGRNMAVSHQNSISLSIP